jgi:AraC-like DNA-binding protein
MPAPSPADGTVSVHVLRALLFGALAHGIGTHDVLARLELRDQNTATELLADGDARVPAAWVLRLWQELPVWCGDEWGFGLRLANQIAASGLTSAWWIVQSSANWREGLQTAVRYQRLLHDQNRSRVVFDARGARYVHRIGDGAFRAPNVALEFGMALMVHLAQQSTGVHVRPARVRFRHAAPPDIRLHEAIFGTEIEFRAQEDELYFEQATLELPHATANSALREILESHAQSLLRALPEGPDTAARVRLILSRVIRGGQTELRDVAAGMGLSDRTLQRRLQAEGTSFGALLDQVRKELALRYLSDPQLSMTDAALLLGFSDDRAFHRAFLRWTGMTPGAYRRARR